MALVSSLSKFAACVVKSSDFALKWLTNETRNHLLLLLTEIPLSFEPESCFCSNWSKSEQSDSESK
jgi:hypothetical protein